ncbi:MAG TPA: hypothetical protein VHO01_02240 [Jatrophihabitans sp.]|nr:hypothetical protein [Jatrophihabitans sp.]
MQELQPLAALLARQAADLEVYAGFLYAALDGSLPAELVQVQRRQAVADRLRGRLGAVVGVSVLLGDQRFTLERKDIGSSSRAGIAHEVGGIVLSRRELGLAEWSQALVAALARIAQDNAAAADVLRRLTSFAV